MEKSFSTNVTSTGQYTSGFLVPDEEKLSNLPEVDMFLCKVVVIVLSDIIGFQQKILNKYE